MLVEQADFHHVELEQVFCVVEDVALEQFNPLLDRHVGQFRWRQVGKFLSGLMDGRSLLLLQDRVRHIAQGHHHLRGCGRGGIPHRLVHWDQAPDHRRGVDLEVAVVGTAESCVFGAALCKRHLNGGRFIAEIIGAVLLKLQGLEKPLADRIALPAPGDEPLVGPADHGFRIEQGHAVRKVVENALAAQQRREGLRGGDQCPGQDHSPDVAGSQPAKRCFQPRHFLPSGVGRGPHGRSCERNDRRESGVWRGTGGGARRRSGGVRWQRHRPGTDVRVTHHQNFG